MGYCFPLMKPLNIPEPGCNSQYKDREKESREVFEYTYIHKANHFERSREKWGFFLISIKQIEIRIDSQQSESIDWCSSDSRQLRLLTPDLCVIVWVNNYWLCTLRVTRYPGQGRGWSQWSLHTSYDHQMIKQRAMVLCAKLLRSVSFVVIIRLLLFR